MSIYQEKNSRQNRTNTCDYIEAKSPFDGLLLPGDYLVRHAHYDGLNYSAKILSNQLESVDTLRAKGVTVESSAPGGYVEVQEESDSDGLTRIVGRRLTDKWGRVLHGQAVMRESIVNTLNVHDVDDLSSRLHGCGSDGSWPDRPALESFGSDTSGMASAGKNISDTDILDASEEEPLDETISIDDLTIEMHGLSCRFVQAVSITRSNGSRRSIAMGDTAIIENWQGTAADAIIDSASVSKLLIEPNSVRTANVRSYDVPLAGQRRAVTENAQALRDWLGRESEYSRNRSLWERERVRLQDSLSRRMVTYSRLWIKQMMYNRFDTTIDHWTQHYNGLLSPADSLDANIVKSVIYQESRMGISGSHLMPPPYDWDSGDRHPIRSRFNIAQAIDSWGPQQWLMIREMSPAIFTSHGLDELEARRRWFGMSNSEYSSHSTFMTALREFFEFRDAAGNNAMGSASRDLHEDYGFWIRTAIRWLFVKYQALSTASWSEAVRAYNGGGSAARDYRDKVMARVGSLDAYAAESIDQCNRYDQFIDSACFTDKEQLQITRLSQQTLEDNSIYSENRQPNLDRSARLAWEDLTRITDSRGSQQIFYVTSGAPSRLAAVGDEGRAIFHLRVENTNSVYNHLDVITKFRVLDVHGNRQFRQVKRWSRISSSELEDETSRVIPLHLIQQTLLDAYNSDSPMTRLEVEYHWREYGENYQRHFNRTGLDFILVAPIEFMISQKQRVDDRNHELNDPALHKDDYWIPLTGVNFTEDIRSPVTIQLDVSSSVSQQSRVEQGSRSSTNTSATQARTTSNTFSMQLNGEMSRGSSGSASIEIFELGLQQMFKLGGSLGYSRTRTDTSSTTVAREFSRSLAMSKSYSQTQALSTRTTITVSPPSGTVSGPTGTGRRSLQSSGSQSVGIYLYPVVAFFNVPYIRFDRVNAYGQATRRTMGNVAVPHITGWRLTSHRGS